MSVAQAAGSSLFGLLLWIALFGAVLIAGGYGLLALRRRLVSGDEPGDAAGSGLSLHELREMHARGALSDEEFERAKRVVVGQTAARASGVNPLTGVPRSEGGGGKPGGG
ncbi:MAG: SHOCT domain-containing protein [Planctomycetota bacterium]|nr:SHOCT domain-containing protein [Planctomycetota bacterium]